MEIAKDNNGKWIRASYGKYLTNSSATEDVDRVVVSSVYTLLTESNDEWMEISSEDAERIRKAKEAAKGSVEYTKEEVNQILNLISLTINTMNLTDEQSLSVKNIYPEWSTFINGRLEKDYKVLYQDKLYKVRQTIETVLENQPPSIDTAALYEEINESNKGTLEDPIPYNNMALENGKYYIQNEVIYLCNRNTEIPVYQDLSALVGIYVELATKE